MSKFGTTVRGYDRDMEQSRENLESRHQQEYGGEEDLDDVVDWENKVESDEEVDGEELEVRKEFDRYLQSIPEYDGEF